MSTRSDLVERCAFALFQSFIRGAVGTCRPKRDKTGQLTRETPDESAQRRWREMPELSRERFRIEASAVLSAA